MKLLRIITLFCALAALAAPAFARTDIGDPRWTTQVISDQAQAVRSLLSAETDADDPIEKRVLEGVRDFYASHDFALAWLSGHEATPQMQALRRAMDGAAAYGLDPASYRTADFKPSYPDDLDELARADVGFSRAVARFVTHIASGRIEPSDISELISLEPQRPDVTDVLSRLPGSSDVTADLASYEPQEPQYAALKLALAKLRTTSDQERIVIPDGDLLKAGETDDRVPLLRTRLDVPLADGPDQSIYDDAIVAAVKDFQHEHHLTPDGIVGPNTLAALNGKSREEQIAAVITNLERWRWMPHDLGDFHVIVNVPEFRVRVVSNNEVVHATRVIVGKPTNRTPTFASAIRYIIVNPYWNVPVSIVRNEMLPEIRANPYGYFANGQYEVFARINGRYRQVSPTAIDWQVTPATAVHIRQVPGDRNALGRIKFMFPNQDSVYLHDTPSKGLFQRDYRALSHGCVRVQNPMDFADAILPVAAPKWNSAKLESLYGNTERRVNLDTPVPVYLAYFTAVAAPDGELTQFNDIYGYDAAMSAALSS